jgi:hypothetical protein
VFGNQCLCELSCCKFMFLRALFFGWFLVYDKFLCQAFSVDWDLRTTAVSESHPARVWSTCRTLWIAVWPRPICWAASLKQRDGDHDSAAVGASTSTVMWTRIDGYLHFRFFGGAHEFRQLCFQILARDSVSTCINYSRHLHSEPNYSRSSGRRAALLWRSQWTSLHMQRFLFA